MISLTINSLAGLGRHDFLTTPVKVLSVCVAGVQVNNGQVLSLSSAIESWFIAQNLAVQVTIRN